MVSRAQVPVRRVVEAHADPRIGTNFPTRVQHNGDRRAGLGNNWFWKFQG
jgi:hypothetical protein